MGCAPGEGCYIYPMRTGATSPEGNEMKKQATKNEIKKAVQSATGHIKFKVHAQGVARKTFFEAKNSTSAGWHTHSKTNIIPNGRFSVTVWGANAVAAAQTMIAGLSEAGYTVENVRGDYFEVHNGTVADFDGGLRWEGQ